MLRKVIILALLVIGLAIPAQSLPLTFGNNFTVITDAPWSIPGEPLATSYFNIDNSRGVITSAFLMMKHVGNFSISGASENWYIATGDNELIGTLRESKFLDCLSNSWLTEIWYLNQNMINDMTSDGYFKVNFMESTDGMDWLFAKDITLAYKAAPVPEPSTLFLSGLGLIGLTLVARKKQFSS